MIAFVLRVILLLILLSGMLFGFLFSIYGDPSRETWSPLWKTYYNEVPLIAIFTLTISIVSVAIAVWMGLIARYKETVTTKYVKQLVEPDFTLKKKFISRPLKKALLQTNELIETQRSSLQKMTDEKVRASDKIIQERIIAERQRLARELHDSVSQQLFAASMLLSALTEQEETKEKSGALHQVEKMVQQAQLEMRALLLHLRPIALHNNTLAEGLKDLIIELQQKVYFHIDYQIEEISLSRAEEDHLFRIAQEALSNTLRHAKATEVELLLIARDHLAILRIQDNGIGFNIDDEKASTSYGLKNIAERAVEIGCKYKIVSVPGEGTIVEVKVPLRKNETSVIEEHPQLLENKASTEKDFKENDIE